MKSVQKGFTLIELMIVVAIIGILAAVALPAYQDYLKRSKVSEVAAAAGACKTSVAEFYAANNAWPTTNAAGGCSVSAGAGVSSYVEDIDVATTAGTIEVLIRDGSIDADLDPHSLFMEACVEPNGADITDPGCTTPDPTTAGQGSIGSWRCYTDAANTLWKFFPANCRRGA
ncbi:MAG: pilin [Pseudomonadota bacterium]